ncbi:MULTISPECIES: DUF3169 family protein [Bacillus]|uniref:DUF3169 family protein n=1 Tax=Bacillus TaxID=1386 RepID=UPI000771DF90|nr:MULTISPECIES: DUF3169 family protein [Bacillus]QXW42371.1 DUF3169 family protein [Klebsiella grimontii]KAB7632906.1 DUF3169 family protein [Bacillus sp. B4-WWTP-NA-D-NA-NA]KXI54730.1 hypothetical protein ACS45_03945 [Bacillus cereus]MCU5385022.1 DUF3169 family protein [Bacillus cereus]MCZ7523378.1 DUF3169 family protein [Bacillus pacificus]
MKILGVYLLMFVYGLYKLMVNYNQLDVANTLIVVNLVSLLTLIIADFNVRNVEKNCDMEVDSEKEDAYLLQLERKAYTASIYIQVSLCLSFIAVLTGFLLLRDKQPSIVLASFIIIFLAFMKLYPSKKIINLTNPGFTFPNPRSKNYEKELLDQFDDGQKYVMLQGLYKLYSFINMGLVILSFALMFYSAFTGNSQLVSIISIGILLMLIQIRFTISLKPNKSK